MKKFLTVLLALSVVFTYSFSAVGTAFAAITDADQKTAAEAYIDAEAQKYFADASENNFEKAGNAYMGTLTFDEDDLLTQVSGTALNADYKSVLSKAVIKAAVDAQVDDAKTKFGALIATYKEKYVTSATKLDKAQVNADVQKIFNAVVNGGNVTAEADANLTEGFITNAALGLELGGTGNNELNSARAVDLLKKQYKINKVTISVDLTKYSANPEDWSISENATNKPLYTLGSWVDGTSPASWANLTGKGSEEILSAKEFVKAIVDKQNEVITAAVSSEDAPTYAAKIKAIAEATDLANDFINGHKRVDDADYFIKPVPTIADLEDTTNLDAAKATAIRDMEATLAAKAIELEGDIEAAIEALEKKATLTTAEKKELTALKQSKTDLTAYVAAAKSVFTEQINYQETVADVKSTLSTIKTTIGNLDIETDGTVEDFDEYVERLDAVDAVKAEAALLEKMVDVNGKPYYDAATLKANLEDAIEFLFTTTSWNKKNALDDAIDMLGKGQESALLSAKIDYIEFIKGTKVGSFEPKDSNNKAVKAAWNKVGDKATANADAITAMASGDNGTAGFVKNIVATDSLYNDTNAKELKALVEKTEAAIEAAASINEIEKIFADAHDKYVDINTVNDQKTSWVSGDLSKAYTKEKYDKDLLAYVTAFDVKNNLDGGDYPGAVNSVKRVMDEVVYPIMYTAESTDELAAKVTEAKAAVDKLVTNDDLKEQRRAVEALINALPTTVALTDKDAVLAAADALLAYEEIPGTADKAVTNAPKLKKALGDLSALMAEEIKDAYDALADKKTITVEDKAAIEALEAAIENFDILKADYEDKGFDGVYTLPANGMRDLNAALVAAMVNDFKEKVIAIPANPTAKDKALVEAARAAFEALPLEEQQALISGTYYKDLIDAEESLITSRIDAVNAFKIKVTTQRYTGKKMVVKWTTAGDESAIDGYRIYFSTKKTNSGYKYLAKTSKKYINHTSIKKNVKKGTRVFYRVRAYVEIDGQRYFSDYSTVGNRIWK